MSKAGEELGGAIVSGVLVFVIAVFVVVAAGCLYVGRTLLATQSWLLGGVVTLLGLLALVALVTHSGLFMAGALACVIVALIVALALNNDGGDCDVDFEFTVTSFKEPS